MYVRTNAVHVYFEWTENKPKKELIQMLVRRGYDSDPLKRWKELQAKDKVLWICFETISL